MEADHPSTVEKEMQRLKADLEEARSVVAAHKSLPPAVASAENLLASVLQHAAEAIIVCDLKGYILHFNDAACALCRRHAGYEPFTELFPLRFTGRLDAPAGKNDPWAQAGPSDLLAAAVKGEALTGLGAILRTATGHDISLLVRAGPLRDGEGQIAGCVVTLSDITGREVAEQVLRHQNQELQRQLDQTRSVEAGLQRQLQETRTIEEGLRTQTKAAEAAVSARDELLAILSHELRVPLTPVLATAGMLARDQRLPEDVRENLRLICRNVELETRLIDDLLDMNRIARDKMPLELRDVELTAVLRHTLRVCEPEARDKSLRLEFDAPNDELWVHGDASRLTQIFWNLLRNAVKFTRPGGSIWVRCRQSEARKVVVEVTDTGIGISPEHLSRIFEAFVQAAPWVTRQYGGLGLGLAIARTLVKMHDGSIVASSPGPDRGATFTVELPLQSTPAVRGEAPPSAPEPVAARRPLRILVVDDDPDTLRILSQLLGLEGHAVRTAGDAAAALALSAAEEFDLVLSDVGLPDKSGLELMSLLRAGHPDLPAIALTGYGMPDDRAASRAAGFSEHLTKPISVDRLLAAIERLGVSANQPRKHEGANATEGPTPPQSPPSAAPSAGPAHSPHDAR